MFYIAGACGDWAGPNDGFVHVATMVDIINKMPANTGLLCFLLQIAGKITKTVFTGSLCMILYCLRGRGTNKKTPANAGVFNTLSAIYADFCPDC